jgi:hypothetical protein
MCLFRRNAEKSNILDDEIDTQRWYEAHPDVWQQLVSDKSKTPEDFWHANEKSAERPIAADESDRPWWKVW